LAFRTACSISFDGGFILAISNKQGKRWRTGGSEEKSTSRGTVSWSSTRRRKRWFGGVRSVNVNPRWWFPRRRQGVGGQMYGLFTAGWTRERSISLRSRAASWFAWIRSRR